MPLFRNGFALNCEEAPLDGDIKVGGKVVVLNTKNLPLVGEVGFDADLVRLDGHGMCSPGFSCDSALQVTYIVRGISHAQIVGVDAKRVLETKSRLVISSLFQDFLEFQKLLILTAWSGPLQSQPPRLRRPSNGCCFPTNSQGRRGYHIIYR